MQGYGKSLFVGLKGCSCYMGQMVYKEQARKANLLESSVVLCSVTNQRPTIALLQQPHYPICVSLFMGQM